MAARHCHCLSEYCLLYIHYQLYIHAFTKMSKMKISLSTQTCQAQKACTGPGIKSVSRFASSPHKCCVVGVNHSPAHCAAHAKEGSAVRLLCLNSHVDGAQFSLRSCLWHLSLFSLIGTAGDLSRGGAQLCASYAVDIPTKSNE